MTNLLKSAAAVVMLVGLGACASTKPAPVEEVATVSEPEVVEEVTTTRTEPVRSAAIEATPSYNGPTPGSLDDFRVNVGERVYYDLDQYRLDTDDQEILKRQAAWLQSYPDVRIIVAGNADERGTREYNLALGERRAAVVKDYLVTLGVDPARIETVSYGKEKPIAAGSNDQAWAQNRNGFTQIVSGVSG